MSLIQQALEKTNRAQETRTTNPPSRTRAYVRDPMGAVLEQELIQVQQSHAKRQKLYWKIALGVLLVCFVGSLAFVWVRRNHVAPSADEVSAAPKVPIQIYSGYIYRLTGISSSDNRAVAVINNRVVGVGDSLNKKAIVKAIGDGEVRLDVQGREIKLVL